MTPAPRISISVRTGYASTTQAPSPRWVLERVSVAADAGLDALYVGDHHVVGAPYFQNTPMLGRALAEWDDRPCGALFLLPLWHPVLVAEHVATLAAIADGPFVLQCAIGGGSDQFAGMGVPLRGRTAAFEAALSVTMRLLDGDVVSASEPTPICGARVEPVPVERPAVWIGADADAGIERAARLGDAWYGGPGLRADTAIQKLAHFRSAAEQHQRPVHRCPLRRDVHVAGSAGEADAMRRRVEVGGHRGLDPSVLVIGTPEDVAREFATLATAGFDEIVTRQISDDQREAIASIRLLTEVRELLGKPTVHQRG